MDVGPVNVSGAFRASRARVIFEDGRLYVFQTATRYKIFETAEPAQHGSGWSAELVDGSGSIAFSRFGCSSCGWSLGRVSKDQLLAVAVG